MEGAKVFFTNSTWIEAQITSGGHLGVNRRGAGLAIPLFIKKGKVIF